MWKTYSIWAGKGAKTSQVGVFGVPVCAGTRGEEAREGVS
jgi:hypothetical protein